MSKIRLHPPALLAIVPLGIGAIGLSRWLFGSTSFGQSLFGFSQLGLAAPVLLLLASVAFFGAHYHSGTRRFANSEANGRALAWLEFVLRFCCLCVATVAALMLFEHISGLSIGIDIHSHDSVPTAGNPFPGRMSANACIGFISLACGLWTSISRRDAVQRWLSPMFAGGVALVAISGLIGRILHLELLYRWGASNQLTVPVAIGLGLLAVALWMSQEKAAAEEGNLERLEGRITRRSFSVLTLIAVGAGTGGFSVVQSLYEESQSEHLALTASVNGESISYALDMASWLVRTASTRPVVTETLATLNLKPKDPTARAFLQKVDQSFIGAGLDGMTFRTLSGESVSAGRMSLTGTEPRLGMPKAYPGSELAYADGYVFSTTLPVYDRGRLVGSLVAEQRLTLVEKLVAKLKLSTSTTDVLLCARLADSATCLPSRFYAKAFSVPLLTADGKPTRLISRAVLGLSGVATNTDLNGNMVIAAYQPLDRSGLGLIVKTNVDTFYAAMRDRLLQLLLIMGALIALGTLVLRSQVRPLVARLASERRRSWAILENSNDAFVSLDRHGRVDAWNIQAVKTFGWTAHDAIGRRLSELIIPPELRDAHERGMQHFTKNGTGPVVNRRIELSALHRDGHLIPIELSVAATDMGGFFTATAFLRDITERKQAENALAQGERRLRLVTDNMPALISHVDLDYRYSLVNAHYCGWFSRPETDFVGKTVSEVFGPEVFEGIRARMDEAFAGKDVVFELLNPVPGAPKYLLVHYMPERDSSGKVIGLYGLILDRTEQHNSMARIETSERQLRAVANNLPVLITYVDADERIKFLNRTFHEWLGVDLDDAIGRRIGDVIGPVNYLQRKDQIRAALAGDRIEFEVVSQTLGGIRDLHTVYIPDVRSDGSVHGLFSLSTDVTAMKKIEKQLSALARVDALTGLPNRRQFEERLEEALSRSRRTGQPMALIFLDVDHFKGINDTWGHSAGDEVLRELSLRLQAGIRSTDTAARLAGDEFVVILEGLHLMSEAKAVAQKLLDSIRVPMTIGNQAAIVTSSMGVAFRNGNADDASAQDMLDRADRALYRAKAAGRNTFDLEA